MYRSQLASVNEGFKVAYRSKGAPRQMRYRSQAKPSQAKPRPDKIKGDPSEYELHVVEMAMFRNRSDQV
jgi:hypothetical protein